MQQRLVIVSNRLPVSIRRTARGEIEARQSSGGLVSAILSLPGKKIMWIGAADFDEELWRDYQATSPKSTIELVPVFIDKELESRYYNGFSNGLIWPLFHYFSTYAEYSEESFKAYRQVNQLFSEAIKDVVNENDLIWVHDYHFMLLPEFLKSGRKSFNCSFFLHIPFPSYEIVKLIPEDWRNEMLHSLLMCDVVGFHTAEYSSHFKRAISFFLGVEPVNGIATVNGHSCLIGEFPISIDFQKFHDAYKNEKVVKLRQRIQKRFSDERVIFSIDRLDYSKGVINRLQAYEQLLQNNSRVHGNIVFIINVIPSRENISTYAERKKIIEENVGRINGVYGTVHWQPIIYQYRHMSFDELVACYTCCDVALITPLRDGMNLVAKEFVASRKDLRGVLILSEFAGASHELRHALMVNPNDIHLMEEAMLKALDFTEKAQEEAMKEMQDVIREYDVNRWANAFLDEMRKTSKPVNASRPNLMSFAEKLEIFETYRAARKRLLLFDYDGTLVPFYNNPGEAAPGDVVKALIAELSSDRRNRIVLVSGRDTETLQHWFSESKIDIAAEHGSAYRLAGDSVWVYPGNMPMEWKDEVRACVEKYVGKIPGSFMEEKKFAIAWHYRGAENFDEEAVRLALSKELLLLNRKDEFDILHGNKVIEIRSAYTNKGKFILRLLAEESYEFVLAVGDDATDEDMFNVLKEKHQFTVKVGLGSTAAKYNLTGVNHVISFLEQLSQLRQVSV